MQDGEKPDHEVKPDSRFDFDRDWCQIPLFMDEISLDSVDDNNEDLQALKEMLEHEVGPLAFSPDRLGHT
jgi:hypothetical protein